MPMECSRCELVVETSDRVCPQCGSPMRFTVLGGITKELTQSQFITSKAVKPPGLGKRFVQWIVGLFWLHAVAYSLAAICLFSLVLLKIEPVKLPELYPNLYMGLLFAVPLTSVVLATLVGCRGIYLGQLLGLFVGATGVAALLGERLAMGFAVTLAEWSILPPAAALLGFLCGLRVGGNLQVRGELKYKPVDRWERDAKPSVRELNPVGKTRWNRLAFGIATGLLVYFATPFVLRWILNPVYHYNANMVAVMIGRVEGYVGLLSLLFGGVVAGSGTKSGFAQGVLAGLVFFGVAYYLEKPDSSREISQLLAVCLAVSAIGGVIGRRIFKPTRVYANQMDMKL